MPAKPTRKPAARAAAPKRDIYQEVTDKIIAGLETGVRPWARPWTVTGRDVTRPLRVNGKPYTGINVMLLWSEALIKGYSNPTWMTFNQALEFSTKDRPCGVRKGEKGTMIIYASKFKKEVEDPKTGDKKQAMIPFLKAYVVFNAEQIDGLPERFTQPAVALTPERKLERIGHCEDFFAAVGSDVRHGGDRAYYSPAGDFIQMPQVEQFHEIERYYSVLGHEHVHWTGGASRLKRDFANRFGSEAYAAEELIAELGAAFLCADLGISLEVRDDHAAYLAGWLKVLKGDKRFIVSAASQAQKAVELLKELAGESEVDEDEKAALEDTGAAADLQLEAA